MSPYSTLIQRLLGRNHPEPGLDPGALALTKSGAIVQAFGAGEWFSSSGSVCCMVKDRERQPTEEADWPDVALIVCCFV